MSTNTTDPFIKIRNLERLACSESLTEDERESIISEMNNRTRATIGLKECKGPEHCERFKELESQYRLHKLVFNKK